MAEASSYMVQMRDRFETARAGWKDVREDFRDDLRFVNGNPADQWNSRVKSDRDDEGIPALTMDRLNPLINQIVNQSRKDRPQPKVQAGDNGDPQTAEVIEDKVRHLLYESHADVAFDYAEAYCASGGFAFYEICTEYVGKTFVQEPRVKRIQDPLTVYFDPNVQEMDFSDAEYCFKRKRYTHDQYRAAFGKEPVAFPFEDDTTGQWGDEETCWVAEYWWVENKDEVLYQLADGRIGTEDQLGPFDDSEIVQARKIKERIVHKDIVDGEKKLEEYIFPCEWIGIVPVIGQERISDGKRRFISAVRYARDPQTFINASFSSTAESMATKNQAPFIGPKGAFKDKKWRDGKRHFYLEYETMDATGRPVENGAVQRLVFEPTIQASTSATAQGIDALKGSVGYVDSVTRPSQADISGIAVQRRDEQAGLANSQYEDSLVDSMWHCGRILVDLLLGLADTPRVWQLRKEDGTTRSQAVTMQVDPGVSPYAPGMEGQPHVQIDGGDYGVVIYTGPSYATKTQEGTDFLLAMLKMDPALLPIYLPYVFKRLGYEDLEEVAMAAQPPQIQQAMAASKGQAPPPQVLQAQVAALQAQLQQAIQALKAAGLQKQAKIIEAQGKIQLEKLKFMREVTIEGMKQSHDAGKHVLSEHTDAIEHTLDLLHSTELAPDPNMQPAGGVQ